MNNYRRWYDEDNILKEALDLLRLQTDETQGQACDFLLKLQEQVADDVIEHISEMVNTYGQGKGSRWYDKDPVLIKAIELLRLAPAPVRRNAALKLLTALEKQSFDDLDLED